MLEHGQVGLGLVCAERAGRSRKNKPGAQRSQAALRQEVRSLERSRWPVTRLREAMRPLDKVRAVDPDTPALRAMELMAREDVNQVPVISNQHLEGMISRNSILQVLHSRTELKAS